jgi:putative ABC transport system ATP-binding protein
MRLIPAIAAGSIGFSYGDVHTSRSVLRSLSLTIAVGEIVVVTGASGAGKSTLLALCGALRSVQFGELNVLGNDMRKLSAGRRRELRSSIGFIFQSHNLIDALTAEQNVVMSLQGRFTQLEASRRAAAALSVLRLDGRDDAYPEDLSGGEKQRVAVARALVRDPKLILADEPTASLDDVSATAVKVALSDAARLASAAVLLVTHDARIFEIADRVLRLLDGALTEINPWH